MVSPFDEACMERALQLARLGFGHVSPNPMVGCVIAKEGRIVGEGYHQAWGGPHAEPNAVADCLAQGQSEPDLEGSTFYVTLEPCSHVGKTPPCADLLVRLRPARVVMGTLDVNPIVAGKGLARLQAAGIECQVGLMAQESIDLNRRYWINQREGRAYAIGKWAQSANGYLDRADGTQSWLTGPEARQLVHQWRSQEDAVLVGYRTALIDNPRLTVRDFPGRCPARIVIDRDGTLPTDLHLFADDGTRVIVLTQSAKAPLGHVQYIRFAPESFAARPWLEALYREARIGSVIVEGGARLLRSFEPALPDEVRVLTAPIVWGGGSAAPAVHLPLHSHSKAGQDRISLYRHQ